jgi:hypothetical protein
VAKKATKKPAKKVLTLDKDQEQRVIAALHDAWDYVKFDLVEISGGHMSAADIQDVVGDYVAPDRCRDKEAAGWYFQLPDDVRERLRKEAFPYGACM